MLCRGSQAKRHGHPVGKAGFSSGASGGAKHHSTTLLPQTAMQTIYVVDIHTSRSSVAGHQQRNKKAFAGLPVTDRLPSYHPCFGHWSIHSPIHEAPTAELEAIHSWKLAISPSASSRGVRSFQQRGLF